MKRIRILSFCLSIIMILSCMPSMSIVTYAEDVTLVTDAELKYVNYGSDGGVAVKGFSAAFVNDFSTNFPDASKDSPVPLKIVIPATTHDGKKVVAIADNAFYKYSSKANLYTLELDLTEAANLTTIGSQAFMGNKGLEYITIPDSVTTLSQSAFYECTNLKGVTLSKNITSIGSQAFLKCTGLEYIRVNGKSDTALFELPDTLETIDGSAFKECFDPTLAISMVIPKSVTTIGSQAFYASKAIKVIQIEDDDEDYTGYDQEALILEGFETSHGYGKRVIVMPNQACYTAYKDIAPAYLKKAISFEVEVNFIDHEGTNIDTQTKLYGQSLRYIKNDETELWEEYSEYVMPAFPDGLEAAATGYQWNWMYENVRITEEVDLPRKTLTNTYDIKLEQNLADPTILPTLNGKQSGTIAWLSRLRCNFYVEPDNRYVETIGVKVDHPLIETSDSKGGTVKFTYVWKDIKNLVLGPRNTDNSMRDENLRFTNEIKIDKEKDFRRGGSNYYIVEIIGWYVDELGNETKFFETGNTGIGGQTPSQIGKTAYTLITGGKILLGRVQFYLNGGTLNGYTYPYPIEWTRVPVGSHLGKYAESMSYSFPIPKKVGYNLVSWERQDGMCIPIDQMYDEVTTVNPTKYTAQWEKAIITLSFDANGGTNAPESITKDYGTQYALSNVVPPTPPDSFEFIGWFTKSDGGHQVINFNQLTESMTVYAQYTPVGKKRVIFEQGEHGDFNNVSSPVIEYIEIDNNIGDKVPLVNADKGYAPNGWQLIEDGVEKGTYTNAQIKDFVITNNVSFTAQYMRTETATVIFDYNGGSATDDGSSFWMQKGYEGDAVTIPTVPTEFSRVGYTFNGWFTEAVGGLSVDPETEFKTPASITRHYAQWTINTITVTFDAITNGGDNAPEPISHTYGTSISLDADEYLPTPPDDSRFIGWFTDAVDGTKISNFNELTESDILYAQYVEKDSHTVSFEEGEHGNFNGIESPINKEVIKGSNVGDIAPEIILDAGYEFIGWLLTEDNIERGIYTSSQIVNYMVNNDVVFTAQYMRTEKATVIFDYNGGSATDDGSSFWIQMGYEGDAVTIPTEPTDFLRMGYTFNGWFTEAVGGLSVDPETEFKTPASSTRYYAQWDINTITVDFDAITNGGDNAPESISRSYGTSISLDADEYLPTPPEGSRFIGWFTEAVDGIKIFNFNELTESDTLYAQYVEKDLHIVSFEEGEHGKFNGIESPIDKKVIKGSNVGDIAPEIISDIGYEFIGWLLTEDNIEKGIYTSSQIVNYIVNNNVVFTAQYMSIQKATVIFDYNGGTATDDGSSFWIQMGYEGDAVTIPTEPTDFLRMGYTFNGWFTEAVGGLRVEPENEFKTLGSSTKYYAHWDINQIKVNFATSRNGTIGLPDYEMVDYGNNVTIVPVPEPNTGYEFAGWIASTGGIFKDEASVKKCVITEDITFTAQFVKQTNATAIFDANGGRIGEDSVVIFSGPPKTTYQAPNDPIKDGYIFKEWATTIGIAKVGVYGHVGSITMYTATWEEIENTVTFAANNAELSNYTANVKTGTALGSDNIPTVTPELGYSFIDSWDCSLGGTYTTKQLENYVVEVGVTFTANVIPDGEITDFVLTFDGNGGSNVPPPIKIANGSNISLQGFTATAPSGYYFDGWFDQQIGGNKLTTITMDSDKTVYAQYITIPIGSIYTITFSEGTDGVFTTPNDPLISQKITVGDVVVDLPSITANEDYSFIGWQIDGSGDVFPNVAIKLIPVTQDVKYVATYLKTTPKPIDTYTLSFNVGSGSDAPNDIVLLTGTIINVSGYVPTPPLNHAFVGWIDENGDIVTLLL